MTIQQSSDPQGEVPIGGPSHSSGGAEIGFNRHFIPLEQFPEAEFTLKDFLQIARRYPPENTIVLAGPYEFQRARKAFPYAIEVATNSQEAARNVWEAIEQRKMDGSVTILAFGGTGTFEIARLVAPPNATLVLVPSILASACISGNGTLLSQKDGCPSRYLTRAPDKVIFCTPELLSPPHESSSTERYLKTWTSAGFADYCAILSLCIDTLFKEAPKTASSERLKEMCPEVFDALRWVNFEFSGFTHESMEKFARYLHEASLAELRDGAHEVGGEHHFYFRMLEVDKDYRWKAAYGHLVGIGVLLTAAVFSEIYDRNLFYYVKDAFERVGAPTSYDDLKKYHVTREDVLKALTLLTENDPPSTLKSYFTKHGFGLVDKVLGTETFGTQGEITVDTFHPVDPTIYRSSLLASRVGQLWYPTLLATPTPPLKIGRVEFGKIVTSELPSVFHLLLQVPRGPLKIPVEFDPLKEFISKAYGAESHLDPKVGERYIYLTVDRGTVHPGNTLRRNGPHVDHFPLREGVTLPHIYSACSSLPTTFFIPSGVSIPSSPGTVEEVYPWIRRSMESGHLHAVFYPPGDIIAMDGSTIHCSPYNHTDELIEKIFVRLSFTSHRMEGGRSKNNLVE
jgi:hypothetical protein